MFIHVFKNSRQYEDNSKVNDTVVICYPRNPQYPHGVQFITLKNRMGTLSILRTRSVWYKYKGLDCGEIYGNLYYSPGVYQCPVSQFFRIAISGLL